MDTPNNTPAAKPSHAATAAAAANDGNILIPPKAHTNKTNTLTFTISNVQFYESFITSQFILLN